MDQQRILLQPGDFEAPMVPIGRGKDSVIYSAYCSKLSGRVAVKVYQKRRTSASKLRAIKREAAMMVYLMKKSVPAITMYHGAFQTRNEICIVMEYCPNGDLLERLLDERRAFTEPRVAETAASLLLTLQRMHALHIIHRDVKLENIFVGASGELKLGDFGLTMSMKQESAISPVGTVEYMAPEVVALPRVDLVANGSVDPASITPCDTGVDIWALGITVYELLSGHLPFDGRDKDHIKRAITAGNMRPLPMSVSPVACDFVAAMLTSDRAKRPTAADLLAHPFLTRSACGSPRSVLPPVADATAYIQAETSPWPTKGGTACSEVASQLPKVGAPKLSIPESPDQLRDSPRAGGPRHHLVTPVAFWNSDLATPDAAPDGSLIRACYGRDELPTPLFPVASPPADAPGMTPLLFGGRCKQWHDDDIDSTDTGADSVDVVRGFTFPRLASQHSVSPELCRSRDGDSMNLEQQEQPSQQSSPAVASPPWGQQKPHAVPSPSRAPTDEPQQRRYSPSRLSQVSGRSPPPGHLRTSGSSGTLLAPYSPIACGGDAIGLPVPQPTCEEDLMLSWRHGQAHHEGLPWSPGRLLQRIGMAFTWRTTAAAR